MEDIDQVLQLWRSLKPTGAAFRAECLDDAISMVASLIAESGAQRCLQRRALQLLRVDDLQVPVLVQMLQVDDGFILNGKPGADVQTAAVVYFPCFWQAMSEIQQRLGVTSAEPLAAELGQFRDALLSLTACERLSTASFAELLMAARRSSADQIVWDKLLETAHFLMENQTKDHQVDCSQTLQRLVAAQQPLSMASLSAILLPWVAEVCEDYLRGARGALIKAVMDVLACTRKEAAETLAAGRWDLEAALRQHELRHQECNTLDALEACRPDNAGWNSQAAKTRRAERDCPICACDFRVGAEPAVTSCCFKAICAHCVAVLVARQADEGHLHCPFCRQTTSVPTPRQCHLPEEKVPEEEHPLEQLADMAHRWALSCVSATSAVLGEMRSLFQGPAGASWTATYSSASPPHSLDVRLNVVLPLRHGPEPAARARMVRA